MILSKEEKTSELERQFRFILLMELRSFRIYKNEEEWNKLYDSISKLPLSTDEKNQLSINVSSRQNSVYEREKEHDTSGVLEPLCQALQG